jgi:hypothetical protein|tara:strand:- start:60 stop:197 length:138 start_codon:yes stop_codon:yes gene_type:complete
MKINKTYINNKQEFLDFIKTKEWSKITKPNRKKYFLMAVKLPFSI